MARSDISLLQEHYLKRELVKLELENEISGMEEFRNIGLVGPPFVDRRKGTVLSEEEAYMAFPILRHVFVHCIKTFPFLEDADDVKFWRERVQTFLESFSDREISDTADREEETKRKRIANKFKQLVMLYMVSGVKTTRPDERDAKLPIGDNPARGVRKLDVSTMVENSGKPVFINGYYVSVVGVRRASKRRGLFHESYWEYIIQSQIENMPPVYVVRRFTEFQHLSKSLHTDFPGKQIPRLPLRQRGSNGGDGGGNSSDGGGEEDGDEGGEEGEDEDEADSDGSRFKGIWKLHKKAKNVPQEKQRITLRAYLRTLLKTDQVVRNQVFLEFLFKDRLNDLSKSELNDIEIRKNLDKMRLHDQLKFFEIAKDRARTLEGYISDFKKEIVQKNGLQNIFSELKRYQRVEDFSQGFQKFIEWAVIGLAATLYQIFVADDNSPEYFSQVKRLHGLMPYLMLRGILKWSNPMAIMKGITDLFLAQPFGQRSLLQKIFNSVLSDDVKEQEKILSSLRTKIADPVLTDLIDEYVNTPAMKGPIQERCNTDGIDVVLAIMEQAAPPQLETIREWHTVYQDHGKSRDPDIIDKYLELKEYLMFALRKRDKDQMQQLWEDDLTMQLLKETFSILYGPLVKVTKATDMSAALLKFERFMKDLIKVVERCQSFKGGSDANQYVQAFIDLCQRHQNSVFEIIYQVYNNDGGFFDNVMNWLSTYIDFLREGSGLPVDLIGIINSRDEDDVDRLRQELNHLVEHTIKVRQQRAAIITTTNKDQLDWESALPKEGLMSTSDFGVSEMDVEDLIGEDGSEDDGENDSDAGDEWPMDQIKSLLPEFHKQLAASLLVYES